MIAVHLSPGPRGYGVVRDDGSLICTGMDRARAVLTVRDGREIEDKYLGNTKLPGVLLRSGRIPHHTWAHNEAQGPEEFMI